MVVTTLPARTDVKEPEGPFGTCGGLEEKEVINNLQETKTCQYIYFKKIPFVKSICPNQILMRILDRANIFFLLLLKINTERRYFYLYHYPVLLLSRTYIIKHTIFKCPFTFGNIGRGTTDPWYWDNNWSNWLQNQPTLLAQQFHIRPPADVTCIREVFEILKGKKVQ